MTNSVTEPRKLRHPNLLRSSPVNMPSNVSEHLTTYFRARAAGIAAEARLAVCEHGGLRGGHREAITRELLDKLLPKRFSIGRGMIYGPYHRSREADIVIWDSLNYPSLPLEDHHMFFAESVRVALECKSRFSADEFSDACEKARAVKDIIVDGEEYPSLATRLEMLEHRTLAMLTGRDFTGMMQHRFHIGTGAIFLTGGSGFNIRVHAESSVGNIDDSWPDLTILLETGDVLRKEYIIQDGFMGGKGQLSKYACDQDALLVFLSLLQRMLFDRSTELEPPLDLLRYAHQVRPTPEFSIPFPLTRVVPQNHPFIQPTTA